MKDDEHHDLFVVAVVLALGIVLFTYTYLFILEQI
jgi:hypothetical protein